MNDSSCGALVSTIVHKFMQLYDEGKVTQEDTQRFAAHCVNAAQQWGGNIEEVFSLIPDRCTCCFARKDPASLIRWNGQDLYEEGDPRHQVAEIAYNNCFGEEMTGGRVCLDCLQKLPAEGPDLMEDNLSA